MELGLATFADVGAVTPQQRMANLIEEAALADELGLDVFAVWVRGGWVLSGIIEAPPTGRERPGARWVEAE